MKIVYLTHDLDPKTGWGRYTSDLIDEVRRAGHSISVLKEKDDGKEGVVVLRRGWRIFASALRTRKYLQDCDIVHAMDGYPYGVIAALATLFLRKKLIITMVGTYSVAPLYNLKTRFLLSWAYKRASILTAISNFTKREVLKKIDLGGIRVITPGIKMSVASAGREREDFILTTGAVKFRKGYHVSIEAFAKVVEKIPTLKYKIVGDLSDVQYLETLKGIVKDLGLEEKVEFLGKVSESELTDLYERAKLFVLTSVTKSNHIEGFGIVYLEANAHALPVVGCLDTGAEDAILNGGTGFLVPQNNGEETSQAILKILENPSLAKELGEGAVQWAKDHQWSSLAPQYLNLYK